MSTMERLRRLTRQLALALALTFLCASLALAQDEEKQAQAVLEEVSKQVEEIRELDFKKPVPLKVVTPDEAEKRMAGMLDEQWPKERRDADVRALQVIGLLPEGYDLYKEFLDVMRGQAGGFYDPSTGRMFLVKTALLKRGMTEILLAHELTHALQDQHYDLGKRIKESEGSFDGAFIVSSLVEGDATEVMTEYAEQHPVGLGEALKMLFDPATMAANEKLAQSPPFVKHQLMDPYLYGLGFIRTCKVHGWKDIDAIYLDPPQSGKQIMHPEKYAPARAEPTIIELPDVSAALKEGKWEKKTDTVLGEDYVVALVESWGEILKDEKLTSSAERMAKGWNGDRLVSFENPDDERVVVWISTWETKRAADEMAAALKKWIEKWAGGEKTKNGIRDTDVRQQAGKDGRGFDVICTQSLTYGRSAPAWVRTIGAGYKATILRPARKQPAAAK